MAILPLIAVLGAFLFVLLIFVLVKQPKVGAGLVVAVVLLPLLARILFGHGSGLAIGPAVFPLIAVLGSFVFVLLIIMLNKTPKAAIGLIVAIVVTFGVYFLVPVRREALQRPVRIRQYTQPNRMRGDLDEAYEAMYEDVSQATSASSADVPLVSPDVSYVEVGRASATSPIWSDGLENEYEADVYPSKLSAVRALGRRMRKPIGSLIADIETVTKIVIFQDENSGDLARSFQETLTEAFPNVPCSILFGSRNIDVNEIGIELQHYPRGGATDQLLRHQLRAKARHLQSNWDVTLDQFYLEKPWVDNFAMYAGLRPDQQFIVARSRRACTSENEARDQAISDAASQLQAKVGRQWTRKIPGTGVEETLRVGLVDLQEGGFITDQFVQGFDGLSGKLWRQAILVDVSADKLNWLDARMSRAARGERMSWARMIGSSIGALLIIVVTYLFLNMATKGYYVWSLRIAGLVLAIAGIVSIILVLR